MAFPADPAGTGSLPPGADPVAANADSVTPIPPPLSSVPTTRAVLRAGWVTGITAAIVCTLLRAIATLFGTNFEVMRPGGSATALQQVPWLLTFALPLAAGLIGSAVAAIFLGVKHNQRWVFWLGTLVMLISLGSPLVQPDSVTWPTRIWLTIMHLATWGIVVPQVARVVGDSDPRVTAAHRDTSA